MNRANLSGMKLHQGISFHPAMMRVPDSPGSFLAGLRTAQSGRGDFAQNPFRPAAG